MTMTMSMLEKISRLLPWRRGLERAQLTELIEEKSHRSESIDRKETVMLTNILRLGDITAEDIMVPRAAIVAVDIDDGVQLITRAIIKANHSRIPVFRGDLDSVLGFLHIKDIARSRTTKARPNIRKMLRQPLFISPTMRAFDLLEEMRIKRLHLALVVDEYGGVDGLVTIEDLVEEIVGEINDEHDTDTDPVPVHNPDGTVILEARTSLETLEQITGASFDDGEMEDIDTVGGLVVQVAGRVPGHGEIIHHPGGIEFEILESHPRRIRKVRIKTKTETPGNPPANTAAQKSAPASKSKPGIPRRKKAARKSA